MSPSLWACGMTSFRILGPLEASAGGSPLPVRGRKQVALLAYLLVNADRAVSSDALIDAIWEPSRSGADNRLQMAITRLRKALQSPHDGAEAILQTVGGGYRLAVAPGELDAQVFEARIQEARAALDAGEYERAAGLAQEALSLWRGQPLAEVAFEDFAQPEIRRLEELRLVAAETRLGAELQLGRHAEVVGELERLLTEQPARESVASQLMLALYRCGRQGDALDVYQRTRARLVEELGLEPGPELRRMQARILGQEPSLAADPAQPKGAARLPRPPTPTVGREAKIDEISRLITASPARLVTLTGTGGVGKTRLALEVAHAAAPSFRDGVFWIELSGIARPQDVGSTLIRALDIAPQEGESTEDALERSLAGRRLMLVIDNFEHVLDAAELVGRLHGACPELTFLVTSREALNIAAEQRLAVSPLEAAGATSLFVAAARRHDASFAITDASAPLIARICARLDGLPLALELAAARTALLGIEELAARLEKAVFDLGAGPRDAPARQRTLEATIDWSCRLLDESQASAFARFAVFAGGASVEAALTVTGAELHVLEALVDKSLLYRRSRPGASTRLAMLETVREHAAGRLAADPDRHAVRRRHHEHYLQLVERAVPRLATRDRDAARREIDADIDNIRAAFRWAMDAEPALALRLVGHLAEYWRHRGDPEVLASLDAALASLDAALAAAGDDAPPEDRARVQLRRAQLLFGEEGWDLGREAADEAVTLYRAAGDDAGVCRALEVRAWLAKAQGDFELARTSIEEACAHARASGDEGLLGGALAKFAFFLPRSERTSVLDEAVELLTRSGNERELANAYINTGWAAVLDDQPAEALRLLGLALQPLERMDNPALRRAAVGNMGLAHLFAGEPGAARDALEETARICRAHGFRSGPETAVIGLAAIAAVDGAPERAARLIGAARTMGWPLFSDDARIDARLERDYFAAARTRLGDVLWAEAERAGAALSYPEAIAYALQEGEQAHAGPDPGLVGATPGM